MGKLFVLKKVGVKLDYHGLFQMSRIHDFWTSIQNFRFFLIFRILAQKCQLRGYGLWLLQYQPNHFLSHVSWWQWKNTKCKLHFLVYGYLHQQKFHKQLFTKFLLFPPAVIVIVKRIWWLDLVERWSARFCSKN